MSSYLYVGVDCGTTSVRAALVDSDGHILSVRTADIQRWSPEDEFYQQSSDDIWKACCYAVKGAIRDVDNSFIRGIGFDATCSLVVLDKEFEPLSISRLGESNQNVIMWLDHRAEKQAKFINQTQHPILKHHGGSMSLEQNPPKILWLKQNFPKTWWNRVGHFFDLPDYLTWKATGSLSRSICSLVCKMAYVSNEEVFGWDGSFWADIDLPELMDNNASMIGSEVNMVGQSCGNGLLESSANELGLRPGTSVATSVIDAHCGALGLLSCKVSVDHPITSTTSRLALICGTSTCHMALSNNAIFVPGVWGPFYSVLLPSYWLNEGGQSATGELITHMTESHPAIHAILKNLKMSDRNHLYEKLHSVLVELQIVNSFSSLSHLTKNLHVFPDFHGNRSPVCDSTLTGMTSGLKLSESEEDLAIIYLATVQSLAYGTRHILEAMTKAGHSINSIFICGGLSKNKLYVQMHADVTGLPVIKPDEEESVLLGGAILASIAAGDYSFSDAMQAMGGNGRVIAPQTRDKSFHDKKYAVFLKMLDNQLNYREIMKDSIPMPDSTTDL